MKDRLLLMALFKFEFVFATIMGIQKHVVMRLDRETSSAIFFCGLTVCMAWLLVWLDHLVMGWPFTKKLFSSVVFSENGQATARRLNWFLQPLWTFERTCSYGLALKYPRLFFIDGLRKRNIAPGAFNISVPPVK